MSYSALSPREVAELYLERVGAFWAADDKPAKSEAIADLFATDVDWYIVGDPALVPWVGKRQTRHSISAFYVELARYVEPRHFEVRRILSDDTMAVIVGDLASVLRPTGKLIPTPFVMEMVVDRGRITHYRLHEDSYAIALGMSAN